MLRTKSIKRKNLIYVALVATLICMLPIASAHATPVTYTFSGDGGGTINGIAFDGPFSFVFDSDTTDIAPFGSEFIDSTFTSETFSEGSTDYTLGPILGIIVNPATGFPRVGFFNSDVSSGFTIDSNSFIGYGLVTSLGPVSAPSGSNFLLNTLGGSGFSLDGGADKLIFTSDDSLSYKAVVGSTSPVPEPSTIALLAAGILGIGLVYRRSGSHTAAFRRDSIG
jgi:hypothetical protein